jgi:hypothetical protein
MRNTLAQSSALCLRQHPCPLIHPRPHPPTHLPTHPPTPLLHTHIPPPQKITHRRRKGHQANAWRASAEARPPSAASAPAPAPPPLARIKLPSPSLRLGTASGLARATSSLLPSDVAGARERCERGAWGMGARAQWGGRSWCVLCGDGRLERLRSLFACRVYVSCQVRIWCSELALLRVCLAVLCACASASATGSTVETMETSTNKTCHPNNTRAPAS